MTSVGVREFTEHASAYLHKAEKGRTIIVTHHGKPIARVVPIMDRGHQRVDEEELRYLKLVERGVIVPPEVEGAEADLLIAELVEEIRHAKPMRSNPDELLDWVRGEG